MENVLSIRTLDEFIFLFLFFFFWNIGWNEVGGYENLVELMCREERLRDLFLFFFLSRFT